MAGHTPGPWSLETVKTSCGLCHKVGPFPGNREEDKPRHACLYADYPSVGNPADDELFANARLIAAAPDLFSGTQMLLDVLDELSGECSAVDELQAPIRISRNAIANATGATP